MMTLLEICQHESAAMMTRKTAGYGQHDQHVWCWLVEMLRLWGKAHPFTIKGGKR